MADIAFTAKEIRPLVGSVTKSYPAGGAGGVGDVVYVAADGDVEIVVADGVATARPLGIVTAIGILGNLTFVAGEMIDVTLSGPVAGWTGATPGDLAFVSAVDGNIADAAPAATNFAWIVGLVTKANVININIWTYDVVVLA